MQYLLQLDILHALKGLHYASNCSSRPKEMPKKREERQIGSRAASEAHRLHAKVDMEFRDDGRRQMFIAELYGISYHYCRVRYPDEY